MSILRSRSRPDVVVIAGGGKRSRSSRTRAAKGEWADLVDGLQAERERRRKSRMHYRLRHQLATWYAAGALLTYVAWAWALQAGAALAWATVGVGLATTGFVAVFARGIVPPMWRGRLQAAGVLASLWAGAAIAAGPSWDAVLYLVVLAVALSLRWWRHYRIGYPTGPVVVGEQPDLSIAGLWSKHVANDQGLLRGSFLAGQTDTRSGKQWTVNLDPGQHTLKTALGGLPRIASGLMVPMTRLLVEKHPSRLENQLVLTIVEHSPVEQTITYPGPVVEDGVVHLGPYADGDGLAPWRLWTRGEVDYDGSGWGGLVIGGTGAGKSRLIEELSIGAMSTGWTVVWFLDPQGGASSPALAKHADWYAERDDAGEMLAALERVADRRGKENSARGWTGFDPSPARPLILVIIDEAHMVFGDKRYTKRFEDLTRMTRKVGIGFVALSQYPGVTTFGNSEPMRASVMKGNGVIMYADSKQNPQLMPGVDVDPMDLPKDLPGFGYMVGGEARTAPFRAYYVADPKAWMAKYRQPELDRLSAKAAGSLYTNRRELAAERQADLLAEVERMSSDATQAAPAADSPVQVPQFPTLPESFALPLAPPRMTGAQVRVWDALGREERTSAELLEATGWSDTRLNRVLNQLLEAGLVERPVRGRWLRADRQEDTP